MALWEIAREGNVLIASYNNPPMNYLTGSAMVEFRELMPQFEDPGIRAVILQGAPDGLFITHFSVEALVAMGESGRLDEADYHFFHDTKDYWFLLEALDKPVICAMTGSTMGGGFETALGCDIRIAERGDYLIGLPEARLGILPGGAGLTRLTRMFGAANAINYILRGQVFSPEEALQQGFVHEVATDARATALELAREMSKLTPTAVRTIKQSIYQGANLPFDEALVLESKGFYDCMKSEEGMREMRSYTAMSFEERAEFMKPGSK